MAPPSEFDLRAALSEGEGDNLNADRVIVAGQARRAQQRSRVLSSLAVVALVTGGAVGISQLGGSGSDDSGGSALSMRGAGPGGLSEGNKDSAYGAHGGAISAGVGAGGGVLAPTEQAVKRVVARTNCPVAAPQYALAGGGGTGSFGATASLFSNAVGAVVVCAYGTVLDRATAPDRHAVRLTLAGGDATRLTASMDAASIAPTSCPISKPIQQFAVIGFTPAGKHAGPAVSAEIGCGGVTTNGTAVRYNWAPPPDLARRLMAMTPSGVPRSPNPSPTG